MITTSAARTAKAQALVTLAANLSAVESAYQTGLGEYNAAVAAENQAVADLDACVQAHGGGPAVKKKIGGK